VIRCYLRLLGPATPRQVADYLDAPLMTSRPGGPTDVVEVSVEGETRFVLAADADRLAAGPVRTTRLLGPYDLFLQAKDRSLLVEDRLARRPCGPSSAGRAPCCTRRDRRELASAAGRQQLRIRVEIWVKASASVRAA
jgi:hypothetical protein